MKKYSLKHLEAMPTLATGQADDLKIEILGSAGEGVRVWLSRCTVEDGEPYNNKVTVEKLQHYSRHEGGGYGTKMADSTRWIVTDTYQAI